MIPALRAAFNERFDPRTYQQLLKNLETAAGAPIAFRVSETPCFFPRTLLDQMAEYGRELVLQLVNNPEYIHASGVTVPPRYNVANESSQPMFLQVDFGLVRNEQGALEPKLVELQAFPSLYGYQPVLARHYISSYGLPADLGVYLSGYDHNTYQQLLREVIVAGHDPENVILLEIHPETQKTLCDFLITRRDLGIGIVDILKLKKRGRQLFYEKDGRAIPVHRIYNRCIVDELERKNIELPFDLTEPLDVEWAGHPNWYYRISKFSIPYLKHPCVPKTWLLDRDSKVPQDNANYILKPLYSFAGLGIKFAPTQADVDAIPLEQRHHYMLQERLRFEPVIQTPYGLTQAEIRIMYIWPESGVLTPVLPLLRMGRGIMMGVDHNKNLQWVGGSAALWTED
ncbi:MAG TPA: hypothetical protein VMB49_09640 [Acidobacteriaceae bacterium]|nr:hypothetical protein [Acidobacteriaceae bacterium]